MRVLLTGPNSFSGKVILADLVDRGYDLTTISRQPLYQNFSSPIKCIYSDLTTLYHLDDKFDAIIHIAATSPMSGVTMKQIIQDNILATQNLIQIAKKSSISKFILFSTCSAYGQVRAPILRESTPSLQPCVYGASKLMCEAMLREERTFQTVAIRLPAVIGKGASRHWLATMIEKARNGQDITIYNPDAIFNNAIHIDVLGQFVAKLLADQLPDHFDFLNVASKDGLTITCIIEKILNMVQSNSRVIIGQTEKLPFRISYEYAARRYGFEPASFDASLTSYISTG